MPNEDEDDFDAADDSPLLKDLRRQLRDTKKQLKENEDAKAELAQLKRDRVLDSDTFKDLKPKQREALAKLHEGEFTPEALKATAVELGFVDDVEQQQIADELDRQERVTTASQTGQAARTTGAITVAQAAEWSPDQWVRFAADHPDAAEQLRMGQEVHGIAR